MRITLRIPKDVHRKLNDAAGGKRSMNAEIIARLEASFSQAPSDAGGLAHEIKALRSELSKLKIVEALLKQKESE